MKFAVIGGDLRQVYLARALLDDGFDVSTFALGECAQEDAETLAEAVCGAECVILPLLTESGEGVLNAPMSRQQYRIKNITQIVEKNSTICLARPSDEIVRMFKEQETDIADYSEREEFAVSNAVATAEGTLQVIMEELPTAVCGLKTLVIGYGRVGKIVADRLCGVKADVTVAARSDAQIAMIKTLGFGAVNAANIAEYISSYDVIINTVPSRILDRKSLIRVKTDALVIDLASKPGGVDMAAAADVGVKVLWELGLPGRVAPKTSGIIIKDTVLNILRERGKI